MSRIGSAVLAGFLNELEKRASSASSALRALGRRGVQHAAASGLGAGAGLGALGGAALGAGSAGVQGYRDAREGGASAGAAASQAALGAVGGGVHGAGLGAALGGASGALAGAVRPVATLRVTRGLAAQDGLAASAARFGQRQLHGVTGFRPGGSLHSLEGIRGGAYGARKRLETAALGDNPEALSGALEHFRASDEAARLGLTNLPGFGRALGREPGRALRASMREQWTGGGPIDRALMVGLPGAAVLQASVSSEGRGEPGRGEQLGRALGSLGYSVAPVGLGASALLGTATERLGRGAGRWVDRARARRAARHEAGAPGADARQELAST